PDGPVQPRTAGARNPRRRSPPLLRRHLGRPVHLGRDGRDAAGAVRPALRGGGGVLESLGALGWMTAPATKAVIAALEAAGGAGCARFVGGCVRNAVLRAPIADIDIATTLTPDVVTKALVAAGLKAIPTGVDHGTVTAISQGKPFEITTLRRDVETD